MTEKLLLYGGALQQAGAVRMKGEQRATQSDFMEMEKQRGISIRLVLYLYAYYENIWNTILYITDYLAIFTSICNECYIT